MHNPKKPNLQVAEDGSYEELCEILTQFAVELTDNTTEQLKNIVDKLEAIRMEIAQK